ncbi:MFS transporter [Bacillus sp. GeD10]|uniref:MFS transporter n=1 Tax=Bacillus sp. GeD10 TaxID=1301086 RepID=UPI0002D230FD|nr:MFS transporter [Bacillus sp. GeD10]CCW04386.1 major facilitator superfamily MFS_1 [Bacillus sp. GeD10]
MTKNKKSKRGGLTAIHVALVTVITSTPVFLPGAANDLIRKDLDLTTSDIGLVFTLYWIGSALGAYTSRRASNTSPVERLINLSLFITAFSLLLMYIYPSIGLWVGAALGGVAYGYSQPYTNFLIMRKCELKMQGFAFGLKQAAIPAATLLCSLTIPLLAGPIGWRNVFWVIAACALMYAILTALLAGPIGWRNVFWVIAACALMYAILTALLTWNANTKKRAITKERELSINKHLLFLAIAGGCGAMIGNSLGGFLITSLTHGGLSMFMASMVAAAASITNIFVRIFAGIVTDRHPSSSTTILIQMFIVGVFGTGMLMLSLPLTQILGAILAYGGGWGWAGLLHYVTGKSYPGNEGQATAISQMGVSTGAAIGPLLFGYLFSNLGPNIAWLSMTIAGILACISITIANSAKPIIHQNEIVKRRNAI